MYKREVMVTWMDGKGEEQSLSAPLDMWIEAIILNLPFDVQTRTMDYMVNEIKRVNEIVKRQTEHEEEFDGAGIA